jgi:transposase
VCRRTWTGQHPEIASARCALTTRAARWATLQVGRHGRSVAEVADDLGCEWHTVMDAVELYGTPLIDDPNRFDTVTALGLDETLFCRQGRFRIQCWSTQIVDVRRGQLLDVVAGRDSSEPCRWLAARSDEWRGGVEWATLDLSETRLIRARPPPKSRTTISSTRSISNTTRQGHSKNSQTARRS